MLDLTLPKKILYVEDSLVGLQEHFHFLEKQGVQVVIVKDLSSALYQFNHQRFEVVVIAMEFQEVGGLSLAQKFRTNEIQERRLVPMILTSTKTKRLAGDEGLAKEVGDMEFLPKPFSPPQLVSYLARAKKKGEDQLKMYGVQESLMNFYKTTKNFEKAVEAVKKQLPVLGEKGVEMMMSLYMAAHKHEDALKIATSLSDKAENQDIRLINTKASLLMKLGRLEEAKECFEVADKLAPKNIARMNEMAEMYLKMKLPEKSVEKFKDILKESPESPELKFTMFEQLTSYGFETEAVSFCKEISSSKEVVKYYNNSGVIHSKDGRLEEAICKYEMALKLVPHEKERIKLYLNLGIAHINAKEKDDLEKGIAYLEKCLTLDPTYEKAQVILQRVKPGYRVVS